MQIGVSAKGTVQLGDKVTCDGFLDGYPIRIQTHIHMDHMSDFTTSKGFQQILVTTPTRDLLIAEFNGDLAYRENVQAIPTQKKVRLQDCEILLLDNSHMLGSAQVAVTLPNGTACGYSGDFSWPLDHTIKVDELVVDTTYGSPESVRKFTQEQANEQLIDLVAARLKVGPVFLKAHRGTLQRALQCLDGEVRCPVLVSPREFSEIEVYKRYGYSHIQVISTHSPEGKMVRREDRYIRVHGSRDSLPSNPDKGTNIILSAFMSRGDDPITQYSENSFAVALSDHADYNGTIEYVRATGAKRVVTDNTRGGHAVELALALRRELEIDARPSEVVHNSAWGK